MNPWLRHAVDLAAFGLCATALALYQTRLARRIRATPEATVQGTNQRARLAWVRRVIDEDLHILAVQTLRNSTMAASFMASTAVLLIFGILNLAAQQREVELAFHALNAMGSADAEMTALKILLLIVTFFAAFFAFALSIRGFNHASYLINAPAADAHRVAVLMGRSGMYYSIGMRAYYVAIPLVLWLFGPLWLILATVALVRALHHLDHLPD